MSIEMIRQVAIARPRARSLGIAPGSFHPGQLNSITDMTGVLIGQITLIEGQNIRTSAELQNGSGDYALAFSTAKGFRRTPRLRTQLVSLPELPNHVLDPLFQAVIEATEEVIYNSLLKATTLNGYLGRIAYELLIEQVLRFLNLDNPGKIDTENTENLSTERLPSHHD